MTICQEKYAAALKAAPLAIYDGATQTFRQIPAASDVVIIPDASWAAVAEDCRLTLSALKKVVDWLRLGPQQGLARRLFGHLRGIERDAAFGSGPVAQGQATTRFDLFFDAEDLRILEVNATIPAMQAYSDMVRRAYAAASGYVGAEACSRCWPITALLADHRPYLASRSSPETGILS
jgi:hypothetical protein